MKRDMNRVFPPIEELCDGLIEGMSYRKIAKKYHLPLSSLHDHCSLPANLPLIRTALDISAHGYAEEALEVLQSADDSTMPKVLKAKMIAEHLRWMAAKRSPKTFGKEQEEVNISMNKITVKASLPQARPHISVHPDQAHQIQVLATPSPTPEDNNTQESQ